MTRYLLVSRSAEYETRLQRVLRARLQSVPGEYLTFGIGEVVDRVEPSPAIALLGPLLGLEETKNLSAALTEEYPGIGVVVVREQRADLEDWVEVVGMHAVLSPEATDATTESLLDRLDDWLVSSGRVEAPDHVPEGATTPEADSAIALVDLSVEPDAGHTDADDQSPSSDVVEPVWALPDLEGVRSEVITVAAPKGGQGKTTMAVNLAAGLAEVAPNSVVLIDADVQFGDIANTLDLAPRFTLGDMVDVVGDDEVVLKTRLMRHSDDFFVIAAPTSPEEADGIDAARFGDLIDRLATMFRYVIIDTTPGLGEHALVALEHATDGVFVTTLAVPSLRALRKEFEMLVTLGLLPANRHLVVNNVEKNTGLIVKDAEAILGAEVDVAVPRSSAVVLAANSGVPAIHHDLRDPAAKALRLLVQRIEPSAHPTRRRIHGRGRRNEPQ